MGSPAALKWSKVPQKSDYVICGGKDRTALPAELRQIKVSAHIRVKVGTLESESTRQKGSRKGKQHQEGPHFSLVDNIDVKISQTCSLNLRELR